MSDIDWPLVRELFDAVVELPEAECAAHLGRAEVRPEVRAEVERMLSSDRSASGFLESSSPLLEKTLLPQMGTRLGRYELKRVIASGGMGTVFEAVQDEPHRAVALKTLRFGLTSPERLQRFRFEAEVLGSLRHPSIAQVYEAGTHEEAGEHVPFIAMELVPGARDILSYAREEDLELAARLELYLEVCEGVQHGHQKGVIHRDLKPGNILVDAEGRAKVIDFGVARATARSSPFGDVATQTGQILGTLAYMAPEQLAGTPDAVDVRSDVYALGILLFQLVEGRPPHELADKSPFEALRTIQEEPPRPSADTPRELGWILEKALAKEPERRYGSVSELAEDLRRYLRHEPVLAGPPSVAYRLSKWIKRNPAKSVAATIGAAAFVAITWLLIQNVRANRALRTERTSLASANTALTRKTVEAEENARLATDEKERADREAEAATRKADEVLRLSALQKLDDLVAEADRLWPAVPENLRRYEEWLDRARVLVAELSIHEKKLAELRAKARPWTAEEQAEFRATHPRAKDLARVEREIAFVKERTAVLESGESGPEPTAAEVGLDFATLPSDADGLNALARDMVDPERMAFGDEKKGLVVARRAVELAGDAERAGIRDTLAWALIALGRLDDALIEEEQALEEAPADNKAEFEGSLGKLREAIEAELEPEALEKARERISKLEAELSSIVGELSTRPEWTFDEDQDKWWYNQLEKLVNGIRSFADEETGLFSEGTSTEHGWGMRKRLARAIAVREGFAPEGEHARAWAAALPAIRAAYPGLALTSQLGLVPIGLDPESKLWEFAHLETGAPAVRGANGKLVLKEETGLVFVLLPGGTFRMGAQKSDPSGPNYDPQAEDDEGPVHAVMLSAFFLSKYEMTQGQWERFVGKNPSVYGPDRYSTSWNAGRKAGTSLHPVEQVSWTDCMVVMSRLGLALPSEAQWEYGCRAGTGSVFWSGDEPSTLQGVANLSDAYGKSHGNGNWTVWEPSLDDGQTVHTEVGSYRANGFGLHDVHGSVWEWCLDGYDNSFSFYRQPAARDPVFPPVASPNRLIRGGSFDAVAVRARSADRDGNVPSIAVSLIGLRPTRRIMP